MDRASLDALKRRELIERARSLGVERPEVMTRDELIDEQLRLSQAAAAESRGPGATSVRGWFGVARDLLAGLVEQGFHLPDAAKVIRGDGLNATPSARRPVATVTLAEIYAAQGHVSRGVSVLQEVLEKEPEHEVARRLLGELAAKHDDPGPLDAPTPTLRTPEIAVEVQAAQPVSADRAAPGPNTEQVGPDSCVLFVSESRVVVSWELSEESFAQLRASLPLGSPVVRVVSWHPGLPAERSERELAITQSAGELHIDLCPPGPEPHSAEPHSAGCVVRGVLGWRVPGAESMFRVVATAVVAPLAIAGGDTSPVFRPHVAARIGDLESRRHVAQALLDRYA